MKSIRQVIRFVKGICVAALVGIVVFWGTTEASQRKQLANVVQQYRHKTMELKKEVEQAHLRESLLSLEESLELIPAKYNVDSDIVAILLEKESGSDMHAIRFEPGQMARAGKYSKKSEERRMLASSHCAFQVMGWHTAIKKVHWSELYKPEICTEFAMNIWADCREKKCKGQKPYECIRRTAACYNGSFSYADDFMIRLSRRIINRGSASAEG